MEFVRHVGHLPRIIAIASFHLNYFNWPNYVAPLQSCQIHWECATDLASVETTLGYLNS